MIPRAHIDEWTLEHDRTVRTLVRTTAARYKELYREDFPSDVMVAGENWFYIAELGYVNGQRTPVAGDILDWSSAFTITPRQGIGTARYAPLDRILNDFNADLPASEMALFPLTQQRQDEARALDRVCEERDDWYVIQRENGQRIRTFPITPHFETTYLGRTTQGFDAFYTPVSRKPPIVGQ